MTEEDALAATDAFLSKHGPASLEFPYQRDEYYMLEAYLPNRWWKKVEARWVYITAGQHERDLELVQRFPGRFNPSFQSNDQNISSQAVLPAKYSALDS